MVGNFYKTVEYLGKLMLGGRQRKINSRSDTECVRSRRSRCYARCLESLL